VQKGDHVVAQRNLYANTTVLLETLLPRWGIECTFVPHSPRVGRGLTQPRLACRSTFGSS
jgi:cystathionine beta-lyase/cystathionine gamma-synthase